MRLGRKQEAHQRGELGLEEERCGEFPEFSSGLTDPRRVAEAATTQKGREYRQKPRGSAPSPTKAPSKGSQPDTALGSKNVFPACKCQKKRLPGGKSSLLPSPGYDEAPRGHCGVASQRAQLEAQVSAWDKKSLVGSEVPDHHSAITRPSLSSSGGSGSHVGRQTSHSCPAVRSSRRCLRARAGKPDSTPTFGKTTLQWGPSPAWGMGGVPRPLWGAGRGRRQRQGPASSHGQGWWPASPAPRQPA